MSQENTADVRVVVIGAGIVGCSVALHLARMGERDVLVLDRGNASDPPGSTGHAPGLLCRNSPSGSMSAMARYSADLFAEMPAGRPAMTRVGSLEVTRDPDRLPELRHKLDAARENGLDARIVTAQEAGAIVPYIDPARLAGGLLVEGDGAVDVKRALGAIRAEAVSLGVTFRDHVEVTALVVDSSRVVGVDTTEGRIGAERAVLAVGIWGRLLAEPLGLDLPLVPVQHPYVTTAPLAFLTGADAHATRPIVRDLDRLFYLREHGDRLGFGWYNHAALACDPRGLRRAELPYPSAGFDEVLDHSLFPVLRDAPVAQRLNGIFSMTPDGGPLLGTAAAHPGLWVAEAVWVTHAAGAGKAVAEAILGRPTSFDMSDFSPDRFASSGPQACERRSLRLYNDIYAWPVRRAIAA